MFCVAIRYVYGLNCKGVRVDMSLKRRNASRCVKRVVWESIMKQLMSAIVVASVLILPAASFAAQADGPRALDRVVQQNEKYERDHPRQPPSANGERKAVDKSMTDPTSTGNSR
jgi:hypothetical protein